MTVVFVEGRDGWNMLPTVLSDTADVVEYPRLISIGGAARVSGVGKADPSADADRGLSDWWSYLLCIFFLLGL